MSIAVIFNPHARKNRASAKRVAELARILDRDGGLYPTQEVGEIEDALQQAARFGQRYILVDGGDGAAHWVVNEAIRLWGIDEVYERFVFATSRGGTIDFLSRAIGTTGNPRSILGKLQTQIRGGAGPELVDMPMIRVHGEQLEDDEWAPFDRYVWASAIAGYGANFYGPWYRSPALSGPARIVTLLGEGLATAGAQALLRGPLESLKLERQIRNEHDYLRPFHGEVHVDGVPFADAAGKTLRSFSVVHAASVPVNLGGVLKVFQEAEPPWMHVHVGALMPRDVPGALAQAARGKPMRAPGFYDGRAKRIDLIPDPGVTLTPSLDGDLFHGVGRLTLEMDGRVRFARVRA